MNKIEIYGSGFPATNKTWRFIRDMINDVHKLTALGGENYILKGCEVVNTDVSEGWLVIASELVRFEGGTLGTEVTITEAVEQTTYLEDIAPSDGVGDDKDTYFSRVAKFGNNGVVTVLWANLTRLNPLTEIQRRLPPKKIVYDYYGDGSDLAEGWQFCDGTNGTPDLRGMFIVGQDPNDPDYAEIGNQGGSKNVALTVAQMPQHNHTGNVLIPPHNITISQTAGTSAGGGRLATGGDIPEGSVTVPISSSLNASITTNNKGNSQEHENRPPYYALAKITDIGV